MNATYYALKLKEILDQCDLQPDERVAIEYFADGKVFKIKESYPDFQKSLEEMLKIVPLLRTAFHKVHKKDKFSALYILLYKAERANL